MQFDGALVAAVCPFTKTDLVSHSGALSASRPLQVSFCEKASASRPLRKGPLQANFCRQASANRPLQANFCRQTSANRPLQANLCKHAPANRPSQAGFCRQAPSSKTLQASPRRKAFPGRPLQAGSCRLLQASRNDMWRFKKELLSCNMQSPCDEITRIRWALGMLLFRLTLGLEQVVIVRHLSSVFSHCTHTR